MAQRVSSRTNIGNVTDGSQVASGDYNIQVGAYGHLIIRNDRKPAPPKLRQQPIKIMPRRFCGLLDRQSETTHVVETIQSLQSVELNGEPGAGKTSLLKHLAYLPQAESFKGGVIYFQVNGESTADLAQAIFNAFYKYDSPTKPTEMDLRLCLQQVSALLLLDDAEFSPEQLEYLMNLAPECVFITASSKRTLAGETAVVSLKGLPTADAVALFQREFGRILSDEEVVAVTRLCEALNCQPKKVLQAATRARQEDRPLLEMIAKYGDVLSPEATAASIGRLPEDEWKTLKAVAVFFGAPVQLEHVAAVAEVENVNNSIDSLERKGLVESNEERYSVPSDLNNVLKDDLTYCRARALIHYTDWTERHHSERELIAAEAQVILLLLQWGLAARCWTEVLRLAHAADEALTITGKWDMWASVLRSALAAARDKGNRAEEAWALHQLGSRALCLHEHATAKADLTEALSIREELGDANGAAVTRHNLNLMLSPPPPESESQDTQADTAVGPPPGAKPAIPLALKIAVPVLLTLIGGLVTWWLISSRQSVVSAGIVSFSAAPTTLAKAGQAQLCYEVSNAWSINISPGIGDRTAAKDCVQVALQETTTYTLAVTGANGNFATRQLTIVVEPSQVVPADSKSENVNQQTSPEINTPAPLPPRIVTFEYPSQTNAGTRIQLCYETTDATSARIDPEVGEVKIGAGKQCVSVSPDATTEYKLTAVNAEGKSVSKKGRVIVVQPPATIAGFTADPSSVLEKGEVKLCYQVTNANALRLNGREVRPVDQGCVTVVVVQTTTYTLTATGLNGGVTESKLTVRAEHQPIAIEEFSARPDTIVLGFESSLCYRVERAASVSIEQRFRRRESAPRRGRLDPVGRQCVTVAPTETTTYTLTATAPDREPATRQVTVTVTEPPKPPDNRRPEVPKPAPVDRPSETVSNRQPGARQGTVTVSESPKPPSAPEGAVVTNEGVQMFPKIVSFSATPDIIAAATRTKLCYVITGKGTALITSKGTAHVSPRPRPVPIGANCVEVTVKKTTDYTLTVTGLGGYQDTRTIRVVLKPVE